VCGRILFQWIYSGDRGDRQQTIRLRFPIALLLTAL
jgi:hypothetical protein